MLGTVRKIVVLTLCACLLLVAQPALLHPAFSNPATVLGFSPPYTLARVGTSFIVNVSLTNSPLFSLFEIMVAYNTSMLSALNATITVPWPGFTTINELAGTIELQAYGSTFLSGDLTLGSIEFQSIMQGNSTLQFQQPPTQVKYGGTEIPLTLDEGQVEALTLSLTIATDSGFYFRGQNVTAFGNITAAGAPVNSLVGIEVRSPENDTVAMRTLTAGTVPSNSLWKVNITNFYPCDQYGNPTYIFNAGFYAYFYVAVQNLWDQTFPVLVAVNMYDNYGGTVGFQDQALVVGPFSTLESFIQVYIPSNTLNGTATAIASIFSDKPSEGGYPYSFENATSFQISSSVTTPPVVPPSSGSYQAAFNLTFRPSPLTSMGEFRVYANALYRDLDVNAQTRFAYVNLWVSKTDPSANYTTVQAAVNGASSASAIYVSQGTYKENVNVNKTALTIIGDYNNPPTINGGAADNVMRVLSPYIRLINLCIMNSSTTPDHNSGVYVYAQFPCDVRNITLHDNGVGISINNVPNSASIFENSIYNNTIGVSVNNANSTSIFENSIYNNPVGVSVNNTYFAIIFENNVYNNPVGVSIGNSYNSSILENNVYNNPVGVSVNNASRTSIMNSLITKNGIGLKLENATFSSINANQVTSNNQGVLLEGLLSYNNSVSNNNVSANYIGVEVLLTTNSTVESNMIASNSVYGILISEANYTEVFGNDFIGNIDQAYSGANTTAFDSGYPSGGNYWDDYGGSDLYSGPYQNVTGSDGIGDVNYAVDGGCVDHYPFVEPSYWQDVGITNMFSGALSPPYALRTVVGQNYNDTISVRIINYGASSQVCNVVVSWNITNNINQTTMVMNGKSFTTWNSTWNTSGLSLGNYSIRASVSLSQSDMNSTNNLYVLGSLVVVTIPGDVDGSSKVGPRDLALLIASYGAPSGTRPFNPNCDIDGSGHIGPKDLAILIAHYGQHYP